MKPQQISGSTYEVLGIQLRGRCKESNGVYRDLLQTYYYGPSSGCNATPNGQGQKSTLVSFAGTGFQAVVVTPMLAALNKGWINNGIWARWVDSPTDPWEMVGAFASPGVTPSGAGSGATITTLTVSGSGAILTFTAVPIAAGSGYQVGDILLLGGAGTGGYFTVLTVSGTGGALTVGLTPGITPVGGAGYAPAVAATTTNVSSYNNPAGDGGVGSLTSRLPLDNNVTIRRYTAVRGKNWKGNVRPAPIDVSHATDDQLNAAGQAAWKPLVGNANPAVLGMYAPISDGDSTLVPILISATESQMIRNPTRIAYAPLVLPGIDPVTGGMNALIDLALGESKRRKEKKSVTF